MQHPTQNGAIEVFLVYNIVLSGTLPKRDLLYISIKGSIHGTLGPVFANTRGYAGQAGIEMKLHGLKAVAS